jgi:hypothetical protein
MLFITDSIVAVFDCTVPVELAVVPQGALTRVEVPYCEAIAIATLGVLAAKMVPSTLFPKVVGLVA